MRILICAGNITTAKSYPFWPQLLELLSKGGHEVKKLEGILPEQQIIDLINWASVVVSIDSFVPHLIRYHKIDKRVIVLWGKSSPEIFGYKEHINLLKDCKYLRPNQFLFWKDEPVDVDSFVSPEVILQEIEKCQL